MLNPEQGPKYLVTARHIAHLLQGKCQIEAFKDEGFSPLQVTTVGYAPGAVDMSMLAPLNVLRRHGPFHFQPGPTD